MRLISVGGLEVSRIGPGVAGMSVRGAGPDRDVEEASRTMQRTVELAVTHLGSDDARGPRAAERPAGRAVVGRRDRVVLAPKGRFGSPTAEERVDGTASAGNVLQLDRVGPVAPIGRSSGAQASLRRARAAHREAAPLTEYSLWTRELGSYLLPLLRDLGVGLVACSPLGHSFLTGTLRCLDGLDPDDWRHTNPQFTGKNLRSSLRVFEEIQSVAKDARATPAQIAMAWLHAQDDGEPDDLVLAPGLVARLKTLPTASADRHDDDALPRSTAVRAATS